MYVRNSRLFRNETDEKGVYLSELLQGLFHIREGNIKNRSQGICGNLMDVTPHAQEIICELAKDWEHHSGAYSFPVPGTRNGEKPYHAYNNAVDMFSKKTKYGQLRMSLVDHCLKKLRGMNHVDKMHSRIEELIQLAMRTGVVFEVSVKTDSANPSMNNREMVSSVRVARGNY